MNDLSLAAEPSSEKYYSFAEKYENQVECK
jgi:hypothetical protein